MSDPIADDLKAHWKAQHEKADQRLGEVLSEGIANIAAICAEGVADAQLAKFSQALGLPETATIEECLAAIAALRSPPRLTAVRADPPYWMPVRGFAPWSTGGDADKASGPFFQLHTNQQRTRLYILCPTFLRGPLGIRCDRVHAISY